MALLPILCYPDPRLHKVAKPVQAWIGIAKDGEQGHGIKTE